MRIPREKAGESVAHRFTANRITQGAAQLGHTVGVTDRSGTYDQFTHLASRTLSFPFAWRCGVGSVRTAA